MTKFLLKYFIFLLFIFISIFPRDLPAQKNQSLYRTFDENAKTGNISIDKAITYYNIFKNSQNTKAIAFTAKVLAQCYLNSGELDSASVYIKLALDIYKKTPDANGYLYAKIVEAAIFDAYGDRIKSIEIFHNAEKVINDSTEDYVKVKIYQNIGNTLLSLGKMDSVKIYFQKALNTASASKDTLLTASCLRSFSYYYLSISDYGSSVKYLKYSLSLEKVYGKSPTLGKTLLNMGVIYSEWGKKTDAIRYIKESLSILKTKNDKTTYAWALYNLGTCYFGQHKLDSAYYYNSAGKQYFEKYGILDGIASANYMEGEILYSNKKYIQALEKYRIAEEILTAVSSQERLATLYNRIGSTYLDMKDYTLAEKYLTLGYNLSVALDYKHLVNENVSGLALVYEYLGNYKKAYTYLRIEKNLHDSIFSEKSDSIAAEMNASFDSERKLMRIQVLGQENTIKSEKLKRNTILLIAVVIAFVIIAFLGLLIFRQSKLKSSLKNLQLDQKLLRSQMNPHFLFNALSTIQGYMQENDPVKASVYLSEFSKLMRAILESSINDDIPLDKEEEIINTYLYLQRVRFNSKFDYSVIVNSETEKDWIMVPPMLVQPFVENAVEYGMKNINYQGKITITYVVKNEYLNVTVEDNGPGMNTDNKKSKEHRSRATEITKQRLDIIRHKFKKNVVFTIEEINNGSETGVKVFLSIPIEND